MKKFDLEALRTRVSEGERSRELNGDIHEALFGTKLGSELGLSKAFANMRYYTNPESGNGLLSPIMFTEHVENAEMALPGPEWPEYQITRRYCTGYHASVGTDPDGVGCETAAQALLEAALRARINAARLASLPEQSQ